MGDTERFLCPEAPQGPVWYHFLFKERLLYLAHACLCAKSLASVCPTLCNHMDYWPSGSSVHGILQARILE